MAILIDPPRWPAHGTVFAHLVSDESLNELHAFAEAAGLPSQAFDHDHYDVPARRYDDVVALGALPVSERDLIRRLLASGLRVHAPDRTPSRAEAREVAVRSWAGLGLPSSMRDDLLSRWGEPHRHYHDVRHLAQCLMALEQLGCDDPVVVLAAWFHDAVYDGVPGDDEEASARLAEHLLSGFVGGSEVAALVRMTATHEPTNDRGAFLSDADLSILGQNPGRYHVYVRDVRLDYAHVPDDQWRVGRSQVLRQLLELDPLFRTDRGRELWSAQARLNLDDELSRWS